LFFLYFLIFFNVESGRFDDGGGGVESFFLGKGKIWVVGVVTVPLTSDEQMFRKWTTSDNIFLILTAAG